MGGERVFFSSVATTLSLACNVKRAEEAERVSVITHHYLVVRVVVVIILSNNQAVVVV